MNTDDENIESMKKKIKNYYTNYFDITLLLKLLHEFPIQYREFGYESFELDEYKSSEEKKVSRFYRNLNVSDPIQLAQWLETNIPKKVYLGAQYKTKINKTIEHTEWECTDLKFDIDIDASESIRKGICECTGKNMCDACFEIAKEAAYFLIEVLDQDFACTEFPSYKKNALILFSGTKGLHIHYPNITRIKKEFTIKQEESARRFIIDYFKMIESSKNESEKISRESFISTSLQKHFETFISYRFFVKTPIQKLKSMEWNGIRELKNGIYNKGKKMKEKEIEPILLKIKNDLAVTPSLVLNKDTFHKTYNLYYDTVFKNILLYRYPRYDGVITYDLKRLIKVPNTVDGNTGRIVQEIKYEKLWDTSFSDLLTVDHFNT